ncbi:MAG: hypothetical protein LBT22_01825 [Peptococcaceae bacterium]|jgi:hypothetical protein|nr:hypothetical protein [Peptococcaceae bacterium]
MRFSDFLGCRWDEVRLQTEKLGIAFTVKETKAPKSSEIQKTGRVVRLREMNGQIEYVVAAETVEKTTPSN